MRFVRFLFWLGFIFIIIALLWITISYYSFRKIPFTPFLLLFAGLIIISVLVFYHHSHKE